jgi:hypothetical protein
MLEIFSIFILFFNSYLFLTQYCLYLLKISHELKEMIQSEIVSINQ